MAGLRGEPSGISAGCIMPRGRPALARVWAPSAWSRPVAGDRRRDMPRVSMARAPPPPERFRPHNQTHAAD